MAVFLASDVVRPEAPDAVKQLRSLGVTTMLTGDTKETAHTVRLVQIRPFIELLPKDKVSHIRSSFARWP